MSDAKNGQPDDAELSLPDSLLPWYATGRLSAEDRAQVETALAGDEELRRRLALVRDESAETIALNETLRTPSAAAMDRLMAKIDLYEAAHPRRVPVSERALDWVSNVIAGLSPRTLAWSAMAAAVVICLEAGLLTGLVADRHDGAPYKTASWEDATSESKGTYALVSFAGTLTLQEMTAFLLEHHVSLLEGPKPGGLYRIKLADEKLPAEALNAKLAELRARANVVSFIVPEAAK